MLHTQKYRKNKKLRQTTGRSSKGMTLDHEFSFSSSLFFYEGREKGKRITKVVVKSYAFLLDHTERLHKTKTNLAKRLRSTTFAIAKMKEP